MRKTMTAKLIETLPLPMGKRLEVRDIYLPGLVLRVSKNGSKVWYATPRVDGRPKRIKIGTYPILSLTDARDKARDLLKDAQLGLLTETVIKAEAAKQATLGEVIPQFIDLYAKPRNRDWKETQSILTKFKPLYGRPVGEIKRAEIVHVLDGLAKITPYRANRAMSAIKKLYAWCLDRGTVEFSPVAGLKPPTKESARDRVLSDDELAACWNAAQAEGFPFAQFIQLVILTGQRRGEVAGLQWSEIDFARGVWTIPAKRAKNKTTHAVPLAPLALDILKSIPRFLNSDYTFTTNGRNPISGFGRLKDRLDEVVGVNDWRVHDIRRTVATNMAMMGIQPHIIEAVLNHKSGIVSGVAAIYNRHAYFEEKKAALEKWASHLEKLVQCHSLPSGKDSRPTMLLTFASGSAQQQIS
jgi:integrase